MVFDSRSITSVPDKPVSEDRFQETELQIAFKRIRCYRCDHIAVYKYRVQEVRRRKEILSDQDEEVREDHQVIWKGIPLYAEIPETVKCKNCREVLGLYPECIFAATK